MHVSRCIWQRIMVSNGFCFWVCEYSSLKNYSKQLSSQLFQLILYQPLTSDPVDQIISKLDSVRLLPVNWYAKPHYSRLGFCFFFPWVTGCIFSLQIWGKCLDSQLSSLRLFFPTRSPLIVTTTFPCHFLPMFKVLDLRTAVFREEMDQDPRSLFQCLFLQSHTVWN